jgi:hypothetical protein
MLSHILNFVILNFQNEGQGNSSFTFSSSQVILAIAAKAHHEQKAGPGHRFLGFDSF